MVSESTSSLGSERFGSVSKLFYVMGSIVLSL
jgi:hypothetical protein